jgi:hypothetical protein
MSDERKLSERENEERLRELKSRYRRELRKDRPAKARRLKKQMRELEG